MRSLLRFAIFNLLFLCSALSLNAADEIRVELMTQTRLSDLYLGQIQKEASSLEHSYLKKLQGVLQFDLGHSGYAKLIKSDDELEANLLKEDPAAAFDPAFWKGAGASAVLKWTVNDKKLDLLLFNVKDRSLKKFEGISLSGDLKIDRRQMHRLADAIAHSLFGGKAIADSRILYSVKLNTDWKAEIWECDWDGGNARQVTQEQSYLISPAFIPGHSSDRYLYVNYKNGQPKIYVASLKSPTGKPLLELRGNQLLPAISRQRDALAFISDATGRADLFIHSLDEHGLLIGKPQQLFSYPNSTQASPTFNPDGSKVAFVSDKDGSPRIYIIPSKISNHKRGKPVLISKQNRENTCPSWSPDGKKIAYSAKTNGVRQIWIYDFETEQELQLTAGPGNKENPCWAPDSLHLVFNSTDPDSTELYLVNLNQPEAVQITKGPGKKHYPTWGTK